MDTERPSFPDHRRAPFHVYLLGFLSLLWNFWGALLALTMQSGQLPALAPEQRDYFAAQPQWFAAIADVGLVAGIAGALAVLVQHRSAVWLYSAMFVIILLANLYELAIGTSLLLHSARALPGTLIVFCLMLAQIAYALSLRQRGYLY